MVPLANRYLDTMPTFSYSLPTETFIFTQPAPEELLLALADPLLKTGDMKKSLQELFNTGIEKRLPGLSYLLKQAKDVKTSMLRAYDLQATLKNLKEQAQHADERHQDGVGLPDRRGRSLDNTKAGGRRILDLLHEQHKAHKLPQEPLADFIDFLENLAQKQQFAGKKSIPPEEVADFLMRISLLLKVERDLQRAIWGYDLDAVDSENIGEALGTESLVIWESLKKIKKSLAESGLLEAWKDSQRLSRKAFHILSSKLLKNIFDLLKRDLAGDRAYRLVAGGGIDNTVTKSYEFGMPLNLNLPRTLMNTVMRQGATVPLVPHPDDFEVYEPERTTRCATVLMLDMSKSMKDRDNFFTAKKVVLALNDLIRRKFPRDALKIVGFSTIARELTPEELPYVLWDTDQPYTNIQDGLRLSSRILQRRGFRSRQIILITDGEPTAHSDGTKLFFQYPPHPDTIIHTLEAVKRCTRQGIVINTFMLVKSNPLTNFVEELTKINQGKAYYADADHLGQSIIVNYLRGRR